MWLDFGNCDVHVLPSVVQWVEPTVLKIVGSNPTQGSNFSIAALGFALPFSSI